MSDFGQTILAMRKANKITQRELADKIGVDFSYISKIENGRLEPPSEEIIIKMSEVFGGHRHYLTLLARKIPHDIVRLILESEEVQTYLFSKLKEENK